MERHRLPASAIKQLPTPCYVVNIADLEENLRILDSVQKKTGAKILLALKGFAMFSTFGLIDKYLSGYSASGLHETLLAAEFSDKQIHVVCPAYKDSEFDRIIKNADHLIFNSHQQWEKFKPKVIAAKNKVKAGLRVNPGYSEIEHEIYNPCAKYSRLGITPDQFSKINLEYITGLHFHTMCEQNADVLERTLPHLIKHFGSYLKKMQWINFGGGHHITREDYDIEKLCKIINDFREKFPLQLYLEPGEAIALNTGVLLATVLDIVQNQMPVAILDTSAAAHMPDVIEMPYRPNVVDADQPGKKTHTYRLAGPTCLAGDIIGEYSFDKPLEIGSKIILTDMAHYTMVKNNTFNGVALPSIATYDPRNNQTQIIRTFDYADYKARLS